jgi:hypothetical protein
MTKGEAIATTSAAAPKQSINRAAPRLSEFHRSLDPIIIDLSSFRGLLQVRSMSFVALRPISGQYLK